jgi:hypothetical protein
MRRLILEIDSICYINPPFCIALPYGSFHFFVECIFEWIKVKHVSLCIL